MRVMVIAIAVVSMYLPCRALAQGVSIPATLPSNVRSEGLPLPGGTEVSRPLTPVEIGPEPPDNPDQPDAQKPNPMQRVADVQDQKYDRRGPLGPGWDDLEFLSWWPKSQSLPPLVTASRGGGLPVLGNSGTAVLVGGHSLDNQPIAGGRFTLGFAINSAETIGVEGSYFFLGSRSLKETINSQDNPAAESLGLPFRNANTGQQDVFIIAAPDVAKGSVFVSETTRIQGAEGNFVANLYDGQTVKINGIVGYRYLMVNEGIAIEDQRTLIGGTSAYGPIYDGFDGHNQFNGGQLGLHADLTHGLVFCELTGKVAIGVTSEVVQINGASTIITPTTGGVISQTYPGGVYALASNKGRYTHDAFAVVPEGIFRVGLKLGDVARAFVGYNFLYLSDLARPGDQIDRTLNPLQIPTLNPGGSFAGADRPRVPFARTDFWTQGLIVGFETRY